MKHLLDRLGDNPFALNRVHYTFQFPEATVTETYIEGFSGTPYYVSVPVRLIHADTGKAVGLEWPTAAFALHRLYPHSLSLSMAEAMHNAIWDDPGGDRPVGEWHLCRYHDGVQRWLPLGSYELAKAARTAQLAISQCPWAAVLCPSPDWIADWPVAWDFMVRTMTEG